MTVYAPPLRSPPSQTEQIIRSTVTFFVLLLVLGSLLGCGANRSGGAAQLTVMTYNIHHAAGTDGEVDLERIARVIRAASPDFVALQEVDKQTKRVDGADQAADLARLTGMYPAYGRAMSYDGGQYGNAVLSRYPIRSVRVQSLPWTEGEKREPRCAVAATAALPGKAGAIQFISTHLDHTRESTDRLAQAEMINEAWQDAGERTILAGDINCEPGSPPMEALSREWRLVSGTDPAAPTCCGATPKVKIDHVFVKPSSRWRVIEQRVIDEPVASDHRPVVVKLELRPAR